MLGINHINRSDIFLALNILYSMQGILYPNGIINQALQLVIIIWGLSIFSKFLLSQLRQTRFLKATTALVLMYCLYGCILLFFGNPLIINIPDAPSRYIYLQVSLRSLLNIYVFYHYASKGFLTSSRIRIYTILLLCSLIPRFYYTQAQIMLISNRDAVTNNIGYIFLSIIPALFFFVNRPLLQYLLLATTMFFIIMAMKRGAIAIGLLAVLFLIYSNVFSKNRKQKFGTLLLTIILVLGVISIVSYLMSNDGYFLYRIEQTLEGDGSGRGDIYSILWGKLLKEQSVIYMLFGRGADSTWALAGNYAHQDWLETFCNNGLMGCIILFNFFICLLRDVLYSKQVFSKNYRIAYVVLFMIILCQTMFSMSIQCLEIPISIVLGYLTYWKGRSHEEIAREKLA